MLVTCVRQFGTPVGAGRSWTPQVPRSGGVRDRPPRPDRVRPRPRGGAPLGGPRSSVLSRLPGFAAARDRYRPLAAAAVRLPHPGRLSTVRNPRHFAHPLAIGATRAADEIPFKPSRMIHFFDPSNEKMARQGPGHGQAGGHPARQPRGRDPGRQQGGRRARAWSRSPRRSTSATRSSGRASTRSRAPGCSTTSPRSSPRSATSSR